MRRGPAPPFSIVEACERSDLEQAARLFQAYAASLPIDLGYQNFSAELSDLPGKYSRPGGALLLAKDSYGEPVGCVALRPFDQGSRCEMKRLFVIPEARFFGLGKRLVGAAIEAAAERRYSEILLDTLPSMTEAAALYQRLGFEPAEPYYAPTPEGTRFMRLSLKSCSRPE